MGYLNDGGGVINISSGLPRIISPGSSAYASIKSALGTLTKYQAKELVKRKIRVNIVAPGAIETDSNGGFVRENKQANEHIASVTVLGRVGLPTDIGPVAVFLCKEETHWIHAQRIEKKAKEKLSTTELSVSEIAYELGFEYPQSFSKLFKNKTDMSSLEFRRTFN